MAKAGTINIKVARDHEVRDLVDQIGRLKNSKITVTRRYAPTSSSYGGSWAPAKTVAVGKRLYTPSAIEDFIIMLRAGLLREWFYENSISVRRDTPAGEEIVFDRFGMGSEAREVESFVTELRERLMTGYREVTLTEEDWFKDRYGYRQHLLIKYDYAPCCCPDKHKHCYHACQSLSDLRWCKGLDHCHNRNHSSSACWRTHDDETRT